MAGRERIKVAQYGIGPIGAEIVKLLMKKPWVEIVAAVDIDPAKIGKDLGEVVGLPEKIGVIVGSTLEGNPSVVCHSTGSRLRHVDRQLHDLLARGCHVVSTCEELSFPLDPQILETLDAVARSSGVGLLGTGVNPGFVMDKLPLTLSAVCQRVDSIEITRVVDASKRREPLQRKVGAGMSSSQFQGAVASGSIKHMGLRESLMMVAAGIGVKLDHVSQEEIFPIIAEDRVVTEYLMVEEGQVAGVHQKIQGESSDVSISLDIKMYVGAQNPGDRVVIRGVPDVALEIQGGVHGDRATAALVVNCIPRIVKARSGLLTMDDIPVSYR